MRTLQSKPADLHGRAYFANAYEKVSLCRNQFTTDWHLVPRLTIEHPPTFRCTAIAFVRGVLSIRVIRDFAPLLEKEWHVMISAPVADRTHSVSIHCSGPWARLTTHDHPTDVFYGDTRDRTNQWFNAQEFDRSTSLAEEFNTVSHTAVLHTGTRIGIDKGRNTLLLSRD